MNFKLVSRNIGFLLLFLALSMGICLGIGYVLPPGSGHSGEKALTGWEISLVLTGFVGGVLMWLGHSQKDVDILRRDAMGIVGGGWLVCSVFASLPYMFCEPGLSFADAWFEAVSGLTTTGATVFGDLASLPETVLLWRSLTQWLGGMGILAMFVMILSSLGASGRSLFQAESSANVKELVGTQMRSIVRSLWLLYIVLTVVCTLGLWALGMTPFQAVNHAMTTVSTGGFGTEADSINGFGASVRLWILLFMFVCGCSFPLYLVLLRRGRDWKVLKGHEETWAFCAIVLVASVALILDQSVAGDFENTLWDGVLTTSFNVVSIITTTGFVVGDYEQWPQLTKGIILFLMVIGGCAGSTAGGLKVGRLLLWFKMLRIEIKRAFRPNQVFRLQLNGRPVPEGTRGQMFVIISSAVVAIAVGSYVLNGLEPDKSVDGCVSAVMTCVSNVGPAFNEFGPTQNFASLSDGGKILLSFLMILGRLEYIAILVLFSRSLWRRY